MHWDLKNVYVVAWKMVYFFHSLNHMSNLNDGYNQTNVNHRFPILSSPPHTDSKHQH